MFSNTCHNHEPLSSCRAWRCDQCETFFQTLPNVDRWPPKDGQIPTDIDQAHRLPWFLWDDLIETGAMSEKQHRLVCEDTVSCWGLRNVRTRQQRLKRTVGRHVSTVVQCCQWFASLQIRDSQWQFYKAFQCFRKVAIFHGVFVRGLGGNAATTEAKSYFPRFAGSASQGMDVIRGDTATSKLWQRPCACASCVCRGPMRPVWIWIARGQPPVHWCLSGCVVLCRKDDFMSEVGQLTFS